MRLSQIWDCMKSNFQKAKALKIISFRCKSSNFPRNIQINRHFFDKKVEPLTKNM